MLSAVFSGLVAVPPVLTYFGISGRGELARLYGHVGNLTFVDNIDTTGYKMKTPIGYLPAISNPDGGLFPDCKYAFGCMQESLAVERYVANLSPAFAGMPANEKAVDDYFAMIKEDMIHLPEFSQNATAAKIKVHALYDRYLPVMEALVPSGQRFINGRAYPTGADLAILVILKSGVPWGHALKLAGYDKSATFPKVYAIAERAAAYPAVASYLKTSKTFYRGLLAESLADVEALQRLVLKQ